jgi:uncharacterized protein (DUF2252 family)
MSATVAVEARPAVLARTRATKMARSAHAYVRGSTKQFYEWLAASPAAALVPQGPPIWICGDCHIGNLGPLADADGHVDVQIRDLDQTVIGNPAHDLIRLALSLETAARGADLPGVMTARMIEAMVEGYAFALTDPDERKGAPEPQAVRTVRHNAMGRRWRNLAKERIEGVDTCITLGRKFWPLSARERLAIEALFGRSSIRKATLDLFDHAPGGRLRVVDAAYWRKGCSSLGSLRYAVLVDVRDKGRPGDLSLIDIKEAVRTVVPVAQGAAMPRDRAERVVTGARALSPNLGDRMIATKLLGKPVVLRELAPQDLKLEVDQFSRDEAIEAARYLAYVVGIAHGRQMDAETRWAWRGELRRRPDTKLDAPSWLWDSVVALAARHEAGYLEFCRTYALGDGR